MSTFEGIEHTPYSNSGGEFALEELDPSLSDGFHVIYDREV
jgi:hypothetical protein